jgi:PilZ domain
MDTGVRAYLQRERRRFARFPCSAPPEFPWLALVGPNRWVAAIHNISVGGIAFTFSHIYPAGFHTSVELLNVVARTLMVKPSRVIHCTPRGAHRWMLGARFVEPFTEVELEALLSKVALGRPAG